MHDDFMLAALEQAQLQRGFCAPNPAVGAVAVIDNKIIARASHRGAGTPHAEVLLFEQLVGKEAEATLYVTLEPCNHWGRTPPCTDAIIERGVKRVVYAYADPNPLVSKNNSPARMRAHGIEVIHHPMAKVDRFYQSYRHWLINKRPRVTAKIAQSLDGKIAGAEYQQLAISNSQCASFTHVQRRQTDVILTTAKTILCDNPQLNARCGQQQYAKPLAILDRNLCVTAESQAVQLASVCHLFHAETTPVLAPLANCIYHPVPVAENQLDLQVVLDELGRLGFHDVWVEAGGTLFTALHVQRLVQRSYIYLAPIILGQEAIPAFHQPFEGLQAASVNWRPVGDNVIGRFDWKEAACLLE
ncbi:MAG: bifunctional diaminohydroxyphosphoribosylaminopyrimidine deaminase/5-amino-6-(5-phosphoribosylamino)uracil reductase RibD [Legionellaceae bacterium]|nr:bifunctional diaminohydroxyphosphoribosylaminopyrimidine deaminase/5-amino-6-(5-phosphoribosylamino)uracil reductase RibD [Legionellaceae bacterium]